MTNIWQTLSDQELKILYLKHKGLSRKEITDKLGVQSKYVSVLEGRIKNKLKKLKENDVLLDGSMPTIEELFATSEEIEDIFQEEQERNLSKLTVNQAIFLQDSSAHTTSDKKSTTSERMMRSRLGLKKKKDEVVVRKWTDEERKEYITQKNNMDHSDDIPSHIKKIHQEYVYCLRMDAGKDEEMAIRELILRSYGIIYKTPYINKRNSKTGLCQRANNVIVTKGEERNYLPANAHFIETTKNENGELESVWTIEGWFNTGIKKSQKGE